MSYSHNGGYSANGDGYAIGKRGKEVQLINSSGVLQFLKTKVTAKTANYTVKATESGNVFTTTGASGAVIFTLPAKAAGLTYLFINTVGQNMSIVADAVDTMVTFNNASTADSVIFSTAGNLIGATAMAICDGTKWIVINLSVNTMTVVTS